MLGRQVPGIVAASLGGVVLPSRIGRPSTGSTSSKMTPIRLVALAVLVAGTRGDRERHGQRLGTMVDVGLQDPALG